MKQQQGFTLVSVMLLTVVAGVVVFTSLKDSIVQERLSGNFQKKVNARMMSERAVFAQAEKVQQQLHANPDADIDELVAQTEQAHSGSIHKGDLKYRAQLNKNGAGELEIAALGERYAGEAEANLVARYAVTSNGGYAPFNTAIVGCDGVLNSAGGNIDSYDSQQLDGQYDRDNASTQAHVKTISPNADIVVSGGSSTWGDVRATGNINITGAGFISGTVHANGDIDVSGGSSGDYAIPPGFPVKTRIGGDILAKGSVTYQGRHILGVVRAEQDVHFTPSFAVRNINNNGLAVLYGGNNTTEENNKDSIAGTNYKGAPYHQTVTVPAVPASNSEDPNHDPKDPDTNCDPYSLPSELAKLQQKLPRQGLNVTGWGNHAQFDDEQGRDSFGSIYMPTSTSILGRQYGSVYFLDDLIINGAELTIAKGDVVFYINGDFKLTTNGNSALNINEGASLTLFVQGKSQIQQPVNVLKKTLNSNKLPPFSLYSGYQDNSAATQCGGDFGVELSGTGQMYGTIYAPYSNVKFGASGELYGAIRGKRVSVCGDGDIHYDTALKKSQGGNLGGQRRVIFLGWQYKTPEELSP